MNDGSVVAMHRTKSLLSTRPYVTSNREDERCAYALLKLYFAHRTEEELLIGTGGESPGAYDALLPGGHFGAGRSAWEKIDAIHRTRETPIDEESEDEADFGIPLDCLAEEPNEPGTATTDSIPATTTTGTSRTVHTYDGKKTRWLKAFCKKEAADAVRRREADLRVFERHVNGGNEHSHGPGDIMESLQAKERELEENVAMLSAQQKDTYDAVVAYHLLGHIRQMLAIVAGEGGVGKTFFLHCIAHYASSTVLTASPLRPRPTWQPLSTAKHPTPSSPSPPCGRGRGRGREEALLCR